MTDHSDSTRRDQAIRRTSHVRTGLVAGAVVTSLSVAGGLALTGAFDSNSTAASSSTSSTQATTSSSGTSSSSSALVTSGDTGSSSSATTAGS